MFFRRQRPHEPTFEERLQNLRQLGFAAEPEAGGRVRVSRDGCAAVIEDVPDDRPKVGKAGVALRGEIGVLVDGGYQKFFQTPHGGRQPALAVQLKKLHNFEEDLREGLGLVSLYNESLGTTNDVHIYDRLTSRDAGVPRRVWEK